MAAFIQCLTLTLNGSAQLLSTLFGSDFEVRSLELQPDSANASAVIVGGDANVATGVGIRLEAASSGIPPAPWKPFDGDEGDFVKLSDFYVKGASGEKLNVFAVPLQVSRKRRTP